MSTLEGILLLALGVVVWLVGSGIAVSLGKKFDNTYDDEDIVMYVMWPLVLPMMAVGYVSYLLFCAGAWLVILGETRMSSIIKARDAQQNLSEIEKLVADLEPAKSNQEWLDALKEEEEK